MKKMDVQLERRKPKLPRKRKKRAIKAQGRKWYYDTIKLYYITHNDFREPVCKFWDNSSLFMTPRALKNGGVYMVTSAKRYW